MSGGRCNEDDVFHRVISLHTNNVSFFLLEFMKRYFTSFIGWLSWCFLFRGLAELHWSRRLLGCDVVWCCGRIPTFRRTILPPSSGWSDLTGKSGIDIGQSIHPANGGMKVCRNVGSLPQHYTASQPRRPLLQSSLHKFPFSLGVHPVICFGV
jgi:hypothetical protein